MASKPNLTFLTSNDWLIDWLFNTERSICANCGGGKPARVAKDAQWDTMHNILRYTKTINTGHSKTLQLHQRNNQLSNRMTYLLIITLAPSPIPSQIPHTLFDIISIISFGVDMMSVRLFSCVHWQSRDTTISTNKERSHWALAHWKWMLSRFSYVAQRRIPYNLHIHTIKWRNLRLLIGITSSQRIVLTNFHHYRWASHSVQYLQLNTL